MKQGRDRHGRTDDSACGRSVISRARLALLGLALAALASGPPAVVASTGGLTTSKAEKAQSSSGFAFSSMRRAGATWYGPGLYGNRTACGQTLRPRTVGVAHRNLPCGTPVRFVYRGRSLVARVIDRGPFTPGHDWDLTNGARLALDFEGSNIVRYAVALRGGRS